MILRILGVLVAMLLLAMGGFGVALAEVPDHPVLDTGRSLLALVAPAVASLQGGQLDAAALEQLLAETPLRYALLGFGAACLLISLARRREDDEEAQQPTLDIHTQTIDKRLARKAEKRAASLARKGQLADAAELCFSSGLLDSAADYFEKAEDLVRAAEIHESQQRGERAAELYARAGRNDAAGTILADCEDFLGAAECYLAAGRPSVAAEMFEKAGQFGRAAECYEESGFSRHAAQAFLQAQDWGRAAKALEVLFREERSRPGAGQAPGEEKELRKIVLQAGTLYQRVDDLDSAERVLEEGGCHAEAAEIALRLGHHAKAAELFLEAKDTPRAAQVLREIGEDQTASRLLGEHHRDRGEEGEAARHFVEAGEYLQAGDLLRVLEAYDQAAACYAQAGDSPQAAEMYRMADAPARAVDHYETAGQYLEAAQCCETLGEPVRQAGFLAKAGRALEAGAIYHGNGLDDEAIKVLQQVPPGGPESGTASSLLGDIFHAKGQHSLAITMLTQAIDGLPLARDNVDAYYRLATVHEANSDHREAVDLYEKILAFDYHHADVEARLAVARQRLQDASTEDGEVSAAPSHSLTPQNGRPGRYTIQGELGRGGMGIVYKAHDTVLDRPVAFKVLPDALYENPQALKNFLREAKSAAKLNHPNIVTVYDAGEQDGRYYIAMEYVDGTTLKEILRRKRVVSANGVLHVLLQMCEALGYAHEHKVVHRDIKTANTMWTREKKAKIMDFGLAKVVEEVRNHTTLISGTPYYMSPEQTLGKNIDHRTDIYSLGVTLFELSTGTLPFREGNIPYHHVHTPPPDPRSVNPQLPSLLTRVISRCMEKDPGARYQSTREISEQVKAELSRSGGKP